MTQGTLGIDGFVVVVAVVVVVFDTTFRESVCPQLLRINCAQPEAQHLRVNSRRQREPSAIEHSHL